MAFSRHLRAIGNARCIAKGRILHAKMATSGLLAYDVYTHNNLIQMYVKCRSIEDARRLFDRMPLKNVVSWTTLMSGYLKLSVPEETLHCFRSVVRGRYDCASPNHFTLVTAVSACAVIGAVKAGKEIHGLVVKGGSKDCAVNNSLVNFYAKCGLVSTARRVFDGITCPNVVSWGSILSGYFQSGWYEEALRLFRAAMGVGVEINEFLLAGSLSACSGLDDCSSIGRQVHCVATKIGFLYDRYVEAGLVDLYLKRRELVSAYKVTAESVVESNVVSWTMLIGGFVHKGDPKMALDIFSKMLVRRDVEINEHTFSSAMTACSKCSDIVGGEQIRSVIVKSGYEFSTANVTIDFYAKCGAIEESAKVFEQMQNARDQVSWNTVIAGYVAHRNPEAAVELIQRMPFRPDHYTYSNILSLCGDLPALNWGLQTHTHMLKHGYDEHVVVSSSLVDMYAKCGRPEMAHRVFERMAVKSVVSWNSMLVGYAQHGLATEALGIFNAMRSQRIEPNGVTFVGVLSACAHMGLVEEGTAYFNSMAVEHSVVPSIDHYACMVDLLARAGQINRAHDVIKSMPVQPNEVIWRSFLSGCRTHGDMEMGMHAAKWILKLRPSDASIMTMLSGVLAESEMWDERAELRNAMIGGQKKCAGRSWIE